MAGRYVFNRRKEYQEKEDYVLTRTNHAAAGMDCQKERNGRMD
jgi:hypothetical protein